MNGTLIGQQPRVDVLLENLMADAHLRAEQLRIFRCCNRDLAGNAAEKCCARKEGNLADAHEAEGQLAPLIRDDVDAQCAGYDVQCSEMPQRAAMNDLPFGAAAIVRMGSEECTLLCRQRLPQIKGLDIILKMMCL